MSARVAASGRPREATDLSAYDMECLYYKGITTCTFFGGDAAGALDHLRARVGAILGLNPWLAGRLARGGKAGARLEWEAALDGDAARAAALELVTQAPPAGPDGLRHGCSYTALDKAVADTLEVPLGSVCLAKGLPLFRITVVPEAGAAAFAVVVSLSHTVCDGRAFNEVRNMLGEDAPLKRLDPRRPADRDFVADCRTAFGADVQSYLMGGAIMWNFLTTGPRTFTPPPPPPHPSPPPQPGRGTRVAGPRGPALRGD